MKRNQNGGYLSGFCSAANLIEKGILPSREGDPGALRAKCPGVFITNRAVPVLNPKPGQPGTKLERGPLYCCDPSHEGQDLNVCKTCGAIGEMLDPTEFTCIETEECTARVRERLEGNPTYQLIQEIRSDIAERAEEAPTRDRERKHGRCEHCGEATSGGLFQPGHDAKLKGILIRAAEAGDQEALAELIYRGKWLSDKVRRVVGGARVALAEEIAKKTWFDARLQERMARLDSGFDPEDAVTTKVRVA